MIEQFFDSLSIRSDTFFFFLVIFSILSILLSRKGKRLSLFLKIAAFIVLIWLVMEPSFVYVPKDATKPSLSVMLDVSPSMDIKDPDARLKRAKHILKESHPFFEKHYDVSYFKFSQNSELSTYDQILKSRTYGNHTNMMSSIEQVLREKKNKNTSILLVSDGAHNTSEDVLEHESSSLSELSAQAPIFTLGLGNPEGLEDLSIKDFRGSDFAFKNRPVEVHATIQNYGFRNKTVPIFLNQIKGSQSINIATKRVTFRDVAGETKITFRFVPQTPGSLDYKISIPVQKKEIAKRNNFLSFKIEVGREKIRVLYLCGQPSPEYAFLRQILKSDPNIELVSFVILRNPENVVPVPEEQLSLIPFPSNDIFVKTLAEFDLLIFENFSYTRFGILPGHLNNIQRFVEEKGGGFLMIGGTNSFGRGGYPGTGIQAILPVEMNPGSETIVKEPMSLRVLEPQHPIFDVGETLQETQNLWDQMPAIDGYHHLPGIKKGASLLGVVKENGLPAIVAWQRKNGRVMAMTTLSTWQWALGLAERGTLQSNYTQFWRQSIRWLTSSSHSKIVRLILTKPEFEVDKKTLIKIVFQPEKIKDLTDLDVRLELSEQGKMIAQLPLTSVGKFEYRAEWTPKRQGEFKLHAILKDGSRKYSDDRTITVKKINLELENPHPDHRLLKEMASRSGGEYYDSKNFSPEILKGKIKSAGQSQVEKAQISLWTNPWIFSVLILLLLLEWGIRRWRGEI